MSFRFGSGAAALLGCIVLCSPASAEQFKYKFLLDGPSEAPANGSLATGVGSLIYDDVAHTITLSAKFKGLNGGVTQTHFHAPTTITGLPDAPGETRQQAANAAGTVGVAVGNPSLPGFPTGAAVTSGTYFQVVDMTQNGTYNNGYRTANGGTAAGAEAAFAQALVDGKTYWNIHTSFRPAGEIRGFGFLVPEPGAMGLTALGLAALVATRVRRRG
jgi:hypothetical protein